MCFSSNRIFFLSCNNQADENLINEDIQTSDYILSDEEAKILLSDFVGNGNKTRSGELVEISDCNVYDYQISAVVETETENVPVFHYTLKTGDEEGYALVVADSRIPKVLAYVEKGSLADTSFIEPLRLYVRSIPEFITSNLIDYYKGNSQTAIPVTKAESYITYYCFLPTNWNQTYPYNSQCPVASCSSSYNGRYPAGCLIVAVAQILAYYRVPSSLDWTSILASPMVTGSSSSTVINQVGNLIANIGTSLNTNYDCGGSSAYLSAAPSVFSSYGVITNGLISFSLPAIVSSLQNGRLVLIYGETTSGIGHAWVCDGYKRHVYSSTEYYDYLDMNWGWGGTSNGFYYMYSPPSFNAGSYTFTNNLKIIANIRKAN
ncbi:MAG: C10 family peptidase [Tannerellaceae bacterium]|jgi:hypothetical protein|nr:C10 family peptidase [Tannerellaceae bacterium]